MFSFKNLGHYIAVGARDIAKFGSLVKVAEPEIEAVSGLVYPPAVVVERASFAALGYVVDAADKVSTVADGSQPLTIQIAADEVADFKALASFFKAHAAANGVALPAGK